MRWIALVIGLLISFPTFAIAGEEDWKWIMTCEIYIQERQSTVEVYREKFNEKPMIYGDSIILTVGNHGFGSSDIYYVEWGVRSCKIMLREIYELQER